MTSYQQPAAGSKSDKFTVAKGLDPMVNPFPGLNDEQQQVQRALAENVNARLEKAMEELKEKHRTGTNELDDPDRAPTGSAYQYPTTGPNSSKPSSVPPALEQPVRVQFQNQQEDDEDSEDDWLDDEDPELESIRQRRLAELRQAQEQHAENMAKGHGQYRTIAQDEFLSECTSSEYCAVHFFHREFHRCHILDHHLKQMAPHAAKCKFVRIDAEKAPFFVQKLQIRTLPTLLVFQDGKTIKRLTGFEGLAASKDDPDDWETWRLQEWLATTGAIDYKRPSDEIREEMQRLGLATTYNGSIRSGGVQEFHEDQ